MAIRPSSTLSTLSEHENIMQAIQTKYLSATNTKPSRIKAWCDAGSLTISYPHEHNESGAHYSAAQALVCKLEWTGPHYGVLHQGGLPNQAGYCHVMVKSDKTLIDTLYANAAESPEWIRARIEQFRAKV